jgi:hypothetical protein
MLPYIRPRATLCLAAKQHDQKGEHGNAERQIWTLLVAKAPAVAPLTTPPTFCMGP